MATPEPSATQPLIEEINDLSFRLMWRLRQDALRAFETLGMRPLKVFVLELIGRGMIHPKELAEILDTAPPAVSSLIASLEEQGLVQRETDPADRRRVCLRLTHEGEALRLRVKEAWCEATAERFARIQRDDLEALARVYRTLLGEA